jgi:hypothetical protein
VELVAKLKKRRKWKPPKPPDFVVGWLICVAIWLISDYWEEAGYISREVEMVMGGLADIFYLWVVKPPLWRRLSNRNKGILGAALVLTYPTGFLVVAAIVLAEIIKDVWRRP